MPLSTAALEARDIKPLIASEVTLDRDALLDGSYASQLLVLLDRRSVLVFRNADLDDEEQMAFAQSLGPVTTAYAGGKTNIALDRNVDATIEMVRGTFLWHVDGAVDEMPPRATILGPRKLSDEGGTTEYCNLHAAYEALDEEEKAALAKLRVVHDREAHHRLNYPDPTPAQLERWRMLPRRTHPLIWTHKSGRKTIVLGATACRIEGMDEDEGRALISRLHEWATQPQFVYSHHWKPGDLVIWDNCGTLHRVEPYPLDSDRFMFRITLQGFERPAA